MEKLSDRWMFYCGLLVGMNVPVDDLKHIQNLIDAEEDERLIKLPCKVGDVFWELNNANAIPHVYPRYAHTLSHCVYVLEHLGKVTFLTKEEAEKKLAEMTE